MTTTTTTSAAHVSKILSGKGWMRSESETGYITGSKIVGEGFTCEKGRDYVLVKHELGTFPIVTRNYHERNLHIQNTLLAYATNLEKAGMTVERFTNPHNNMITALVVTKTIA